MFSVLQSVHNLCLADSGRNQSYNDYDGPNRSHEGKCGAVRLSNKTPRWRDRKGQPLKK